MRILQQLPFGRHVARALGSRLFHWAENNGDSDARRNGEDWLVDSFLHDWRRNSRCGDRPRMIIDAGANRGDFAASVLRSADRWGVSVRVVCFDPSSACLAMLRRRFAGEARVELVRAAVGEMAGSMSLHADAPGSGHASLLARADGGGCMEMVEVRRLDTYLQAEGIARVDLLKLDVEGFEIPALRGLGDRLTPEAVGMVQFEYGGTTLDARGRLSDFYELLGARGYRIAKLLPRALQERRYVPWMDHYTYANYVAYSPRSVCDMSEH